MFDVVFFFKQKTAYEMRISDWSSDVCSSDLLSASSPLSMPSTRENWTPRSVKRTLANSGLASGQGARSMPSSIATICSLGGTAGRDEGRWISSRVGICGVACAHRAAGSAAEDGSAGGRERGGPYG